MLPASPGKNARDSGAVHPEELCQGRLFSVLPVCFAENKHSLLFCDLGVFTKLAVTWMLSGGTDDVSPLGDLVSDVIVVGPRPKVNRVTAWRVVASVQDQKIWIVEPKIQKASDPVTHVSPWSYVEHPVPLGVDPSGPWPAFIWSKFADSRKESGLVAL